MDTINDHSIFYNYQDDKLLVVDNKFIQASPSNNLKTKRTRTHLLYPCGLPIKKVLVSTHNRSLYLEASEWTTSTFPLWSIQTTANITEELHIAASKFSFTRVNEGVQTSSLDYLDKIASQAFL
jgi:hypothetical protein